MNTLPNKNWKDIAEIVGIAAIVASLIFVGMQMKQSQAIAISTAYQARVAAGMEMNAAMAANERVLTAFNKPQIEGLDSLSPEEVWAGQAMTRSLMQAYDNIHYQYESGFLHQESWDLARADMKYVLQLEFVRQYVETRMFMFRSSFKDEVTIILTETDSNAVK